MKYTREELSAFQKKAQGMKPEDFEKLSEKEKGMLQYLQCPFCQIIDGLIPTEKLYEDDKCTAILDINPANAGHVLLVPKEHYQFGPLVPEDVMVHMGQVAKVISQTLLKEMKAEGTTILIQNGHGAGQKASHFIIHLIPRKTEDELGLMLEERSANQEELAGVAKHLSEYISKKLGVVAPEVKQEIKEGEKKFVEKPIEESSEPVEERIGKSVEESTESIEDADPEDNTVYITSEQAKRYHTEQCPFAQNIGKEKRLLCTQAECEDMNKQPCTCVSGEKIPSGKKEEKELPEKKLTEFVKESKDNIKSKLDRIGELFK